MLAMMTCAPWEQIFNVNKGGISDDENKMEAEEEAEESSSCEDSPVSTPSELSDADK